MDSNLKGEISISSGGKIEVKINEAICKGCGYCISACPKKILEMASYYNQSGYHPARITKIEACTGCALCYQVCPEIAITVIRE